MAVTRKDGEDDKKADNVVIGGSSSKVDQFPVRVIETRRVFYAGKIIQIEAGEVIKVSQGLKERLVGAKAAEAI